MNIRSLSQLKWLFVAVFPMMVSCHKDDSSKKQASPTESAENNAFAEEQYNDVSIMVDQAGNGATVNMQANDRGNSMGQAGVAGASCASFSIDTSNNVHTITIDFGSTNCLCIDQRYRRGKIIASYNGRYRDSGTIINISFDNYYVNDNRIAGSKREINKGHNAAGNPVFSIEVAGEITLAGNGGTITWNSSRMREWKQGWNTLLNPLDDVYGITGTANGTNADGSAYSITIKQELVRKLNCFWFESGVLELNQDGLPAITLDYGNTGCDANATISVLGHDYPIVLK